MSGLKRIWDSKTVWFNVITIILAVIALPEFVSIISPSLLPYIALVNSVGNLLLRVFFTSQPVTEFAANQEDL